MNEIEKHFFDVLDMTHDVRDQALRVITGADMDATLPGNPELRKLLQEMGDIEHAYTESFITFKLDLSLRAPGRDNLTFGEAAVGWFAGLDRRLKEALSALSDETISGTTIDRGGWKVPVITNFHIYREAILILFGKIDCYFKGLAKSLPEIWVEWVG